MCHMVPGCGTICEYMAQSHELGHKKSLGGRNASTQPSVDTEIFTHEGIDVPVVKYPS